MILDTVRVHGVTSLVVTHDVELAITVGDSISLLDSGRIRYTETGEELRSADSNIRREFFEARQRMRSQQ
jgi:ABC-type transporter Mla maintaining outer membrane lipid asymmetry ATPase subunit MlaF